MGGPVQSMTGDKALILFQSNVVVCRPHPHTFTGSSPVCEHQLYSHSPYLSSTTVVNCVLERTNSQLGPGVTFDMIAMFCYLLSKAAPSIQMNRTYLKGEFYRIRNKLSVCYKAWNRLEQLGCWCSSRWFHNNHDHSASCCVDMQPRLLAIVVTAPARDS